MSESLVLYQTYRAVTLAALVLTAAIAASWLRRDRRLDKIPGPRGWPLVGVGYKLLPKTPALFRTWAKQYGDIFKIRVGWYDWVVIK
jgi:hypothetical protein